MGTEVAISFSTLRAQLENERSSLFKIDENIKKIVQTSGRFPNDRFHASGEYGRGGAHAGGRHSFPDVASFGKDDGFGKRKYETKTVFSRLSARTGDSDGEEDKDFGGPKRARVVSAVTREMPTRAAVVRAQSGDEAARTRNRRMFGSLLGTLQKFKQDEISLQTKEEKKALVERKIEEQARQQKEREQKERKTLFAERESRKAAIKALEAKMNRVAEFEKWEASQKSLANFILTKAKPHLYWLPAKMNDKAQEKLDSSRRFHEKYMSNKRLELQDELQRIEQRILRKPGQQANGNQYLHSSKGRDDSTASENQKVDIVIKREKFAADADQNEREDSDNDDDQPTRNRKHEHRDKDTANKENKMSASKSSSEPEHKLKPVAEDDNNEPPPPGTTDIDIPDTHEEKTHENNQPMDTTADNLDTQNTNAQDFNIKNTDDRDFNMKNTDDRDFNIKNTDDRDFNIKNTDGRDFNVKNTDDRDFNIKNTDDRDFNVKNTDDRDFNMKNTDDRDFNIKNTDDRDFNVKNTDDRDFNIKNTDDRDFNIKNSDDGAHINNSINPVTAMENAESQEQFQ